MSSRNGTDHPLSSTEQFGPITADPERDQKARLNIADWALDQDQPEQVCGELLDMLGLRGAPVVAGGRDQKHGTMTMARKGCTCYLCNTARNNADNQRRRRHAKDGKW